MKQLKYLSSIIVLAALSVPCYALDGTEIMQKALNAYYYPGDDQRAQAHMTILDNQGRERIRDLTLLRLNLDSNDGKQKYYVYFNQPSDVKKMVFMAWKNIIREDDRWLYLPALDLVRRIASSDERSSFVGSHFFYEDVSGRSLEEDNHQLTNQDDKYYFIQSTPKQPEKVEFSGYQVWVDVNTFLPMKIEYYDQQKAVYRIYQTLSFSDIEGHPTVTKAQMQDTQTGGKTIVEYSAIKYSQGIPEKIFSERYLRKTPKKYFK